MMYRITTFYLRRWLCPFRTEPSRYEIQHNPPGMPLRNLYINVPFRAVDSSSYVFDLSLMTFPLLLLLSLWRRTRASFSATKDACVTLCGLTQGRAATS